MPFPLPAMLFLACVSGCSSTRPLLQRLLREALLSAGRKRAELTSGLELCGRQAAPPEMGRTMGGTGDGAGNGSPVLSGASVRYLVDIRVGSQATLGSTPGVWERSAGWRENHGVARTGTAFPETGRDPLEGVKLESKRSRGLGLPPAPAQETHRGQWRGRAQEHTGPEGLG